MESIEKNLVSSSAFAAIENRSSGDKRVLSAATAMVGLCSPQGFESWHELHRGRDYEMAVCSTDVPAREEMASLGPQHFYLISSLIQSKSASRSMQGRTVPKLQQEPSCCFFKSPRIPDYAESHFPYGEPVFGAANASPIAQAASQHLSPAPRRLLE